MSCAKMVVLDRKIKTRFPAVEKASGFYWRVFIGGFLLEGQVLGVENPVFQ